MTHIDVSQPLRYLGNKTNKFTDFMSMNVNVQARVRVGSGRERTSISFLGRVSQQATEPE